MRILAAFLLPALLFCQNPAALRPPATPLIVHDPYFSVWSFTDSLNQQSTRHWTGTDQPLTGLARIGGAAYRFMGAAPREAKPMTQVSRLLTPTRTIYEFDAGGVRLTLTFLTPALPHDLDILSRPLTYVDLTVKSTDGRAHDVQLYFDASSVLAVNQAEDRTIASQVQIGAIRALRASAEDQKVLGRSGDNLRIEWGHLYVAVPPGQDSATLRIANQAGRRSFIETGHLPDSDELEQPARPGRDALLLAVAYDLGRISGEAKRQLMIAYDDVFSIEYFNRRLRPWWRRNGAGAADLLKAAAADYVRMADACRRFDDELTADLVKNGGPKFAALAILAYRQTLAAHKLVADLDGTPLYFSKENFSNGCIGTVDVTYPSAPLFLLLNPQLLKAQLRPILDYSSLPRWRFPFAPHDLGQFPLANGQVYGGGERTEENQMPVEESGNMLILLAAMARAEGSFEFSGRYWPVLKRWADYLKDKGMDPENQLSTDDFAGHLAHNTNLSIKAILALRSFSEIARGLGKDAEALEYDRTAREMAVRWEPLARDGDHYRLAFDRAGTWSQKYNIVWDKLLGYSIFGPEIANREMAYYLKKLNPFGLPLDNRETYTKLDWIVWTATLASTQAEFEAIIEGGYRFANETPTRVPLSDWYWTLDGRQSGFQARSVVGGIFIPMLRDASLWKKWASRSPSRP